MTTTSSTSGIMNKQSIDKNWSEIKGKIKAKWDKFSDQEVEGFRSDMSQLSGKIEKTYGVAKDHAERQYNEFKLSVQSLTDEVTGAAKPAVAPVAAAAKDTKIN